MRMRAWVLAAAAIIGLGCEMPGGLVLSSGGTRTGGIAGPGAETGPGSGPGRPTPPPSPTPRGDSGGSPGAGPVGGVQRVWAWYNPGTSSANIEEHRGIRLDKWYSMLRTGGWGAWIAESLAPRGNPPVILRAPFGTSSWVNPEGERVSAFRFEDAIDVQTDPSWAWIVSDPKWVEPWGRYPAPVIFHVGTADDRELTDLEMQLGVKPFVEVKKKRDQLGNRNPVFVALDHSAWFDRSGSSKPGPWSDRVAKQTARVVELLTEAGIGVLTEAVPQQTWPSASYWRDHGVAFRPHLAERTRTRDPMDLRSFNGLVLAWLTPQDWQDWQDLTLDQRIRRTVEATEKFGNVAVPVYIFDDPAGWKRLERAVGR